MRRIVQLIGVLALAAGAFFAGAKIVAAQEAAEPAVLTTDALANMEYASEFTASGTAILANGVYTEAAAGDSVVTIHLLEEPQAVGTVDGQEAAAVVIAENGGGSGTFVHLALVLDQGGTPVNTSNAFLGDRVLVTVLELRGDGTVVVGLTQQGEDDPFCCPTLPTLLTYRVVGDQLVFEQGVTVALDAGGVSATKFGMVLPAVPDSFEAPPGPLPLRAVYSLDGTAPATVMEMGRTAYVGVYPVQEWIDLWAEQEPNTVEQTIADLQTLLGEQPEAPGAPMPLLPPFAAGNDLVTQVRYLELPDGAGVRFVGRVTQVQEPVAAEELAYYFMGLSSDGAHVYMARVPVSTDLLPATVNDVTPEQIETAMADFATYRAGVEETLNGAADDEFTPTLDALDAMIQSLDVRTQTNRLSPEALGNIAYRSQLAAGGVAPLANGVYTETTAGGASEITVQLSSPPAYGTLFGLDAAAVILEEMGGGSGTFISLALVVDANGLPANIATAPLGDRVQVGDLTIADDAITVGMLTAGPSDPRCCPSRRVEQIFELALNAVTPPGLPLPEGTAEEGETPPLTGTNWVWVNTQMSDDTLITPADPARFVLTLDADGSFAATTDCNTFRGNYTADAATGLLSMETTVSTRMACPPEALEDEFVRDLNNAASYLVRDGNLFVAGAMDSGVMEFTPVE